jgi:ABC-2 type transport system permease protein
MWSLLRPLALFLILYLVFAKFLSVGDSIPNFPVYLLFGIVLWNYFAEVTTGSVAAIVGKGDLLRKINFPKYVIVLAGSFSALINLGINLFVVAVFMIFNHVDIHASIIFLPLFILELFIFSLALAFLLSAAFVRFRDISYIWEVIMQAAFYATPILYPLGIIPKYAAKLLILNPVAQIIQDSRYVAITHETVTLTSLYGTRAIRVVPIAITLFIIIAAAVYFKKSSKNFAENV